MPSRSQDHDFAMNARDASALDRLVRKTTRRLNLGAMLLCVAIALSLPAARLYVGTQAALSALDVEIDQLADRLSQQASSKPGTWAFEGNALEADLYQVVRRGTVHAAKLLDAEQRELATVGQWVLHPWIERHGNVYDSGVPVATVYVQASSASLILSALQVGVVGLLLALAVWWLISRVAVR